MAPTIIPMLFLILYPSLSPFSLIHNITTFLEKTRNIESEIQYFFFGGRKKCWYTLILYSKKKVSCGIFDKHRISETLFFTLWKIYFTDFIKKLVIYFYVAILDAFYFLATNSLSKFVFCYLRFRISKKNCQIILSFCLNNKLEIIMNFINFSIFRN